MDEVWPCLKRAVGPDGHAPLVDGLTGEMSSKLAELDFGDKVSYEEAVLWSNSNDS